MMKFTRKTYSLLLFIVFMSFNLVCFAASNSSNSKSILGYWHYLDKKTGKPSAALKIWMSKGKYFGRLVKVYHDGKKNKGAHCVKCRDSRRNKPVLGLIILRNMVWNQKKVVLASVADVLVRRNKHLAEYKKPLWGNLQRLFYWKLLFYLKAKYQISNT